MQSLAVQFQRRLCRSHARTERWGQGHRGTAQSTFARAFEAEILRPEECIEYLFNSASSERVTGCNQDPDVVFDKPIADL